MSFAAPWAFLLIPLFLLALAAWIARQFQHRRALKATVVKQDSPDLISPYFWPKLIRRSLIVAALCLIVVALARPQWGKRIELTNLNAPAVWIAIDLSNSMRVTDVAPDRLARAKLEAGDIVRQLPGAAVGVIGYAGSAYILCPLTSDGDIVAQTVSDLQIGDITDQGSSLEKLVPMIMEHQPKNAGAATLVVLGDGEIRKGGTDTLIADAKAAKLTLMAVAIGTDAGGLIPMPMGPNRTEPLKDENGTIVISKTNSAFFKKIAQGSGGQFFQSTNQVLVSQAVVQAIKHQRASRHIRSKQTVRPDRFEWVLAPGIALLMLGLCWGKFR